MEQCKNQIGTFVVDYWKDDMCLDLNSVEHNLVKLSKCLNVIFLNHKEDELIWKTNPSGIFSIVSAYANSFDAHYEPYWAKAWVKGMTPKVNIFFWILLQNKILTLDNLKKRGFIIINRCVLYKNDGESVDHITLHFPFTKKLWDKVCSLLNVEWVFPYTIQLFFTSWTSSSKNALIVKLWDFILPYLC